MCCQEAKYSVQLRGITYYKPSVGGDPDCLFNESPFFKKNPDVKSMWASLGLLKKK